MSATYRVRNLIRLKCANHPGRDCVDGTTLCVECQEYHRARRATSYKRGPHVPRSTWAGVDWTKSDAQIADELRVSRYTVGHHRRLSSNARPTGKFTYFAVAASNGRVKIGATVNVKQRLSYINSKSHCESLELLCLLPHADWPEVFVHQMFRADRIEGEWFRYSDHMKAFIASIQQGDNARS